MTISEIIQKYMKKKNKQKTGLEGWIAFGQVDVEAIAITADTMLSMQLTMKTIR